MLPDLVSALFLTWALEFVVACLFLRRLAWRAAWPVLLANALTNPLANAAFQAGGFHPAAIEPLVFLVEIPLYAILLEELPWRRACLLSLSANLLSWAVGWGIALAQA